jgi:hypothetical protein
MAKKGTPKLSKYSQPKASAGRTQAGVYKHGPVLAPVALNTINVPGSGTKHPDAYGGAPTILKRPNIPKAKGSGSMT